MDPRPRYRPIGLQQLPQLPQLEHLSPELRLGIVAAASVLPFRVNTYVVEELIDWDDPLSDPMFRQVFPQPGMLDPPDLAALIELIQGGGSPLQIEARARQIRARMNPHPDDQVSLNRPVLDGEALAGVQHKYPETVLVFPGAGQTCHAYCSFCFRWPQFVQAGAHRFATDTGEEAARYVAVHPEVTDALVTGGDPLVMRAEALRRYLEPLRRVRTLRTLRFGTKSLAWWPHRFLTDPDADALLRLFEELVGAGYHVAIMAHYAHPREISTPAARAALARVASTGAVVRCQGPVLRGVNDDAEAWRTLWRAQVAAGAIPYYMFMPRDTGPKNWFSVPILSALRIFGEAWRSVSGLGRTVRGPSMSTTWGKIVAEDLLELDGAHHLLCRFVQSREPGLAGRAFLALADERATWIDELRPATGGERFFFQQERAVSAG